MANSNQALSAYRTKLCIFGAILFLVILMHTLYSHLDLVQSLASNASVPGHVLLFKQAPLFSNSSTGEDELKKQLNATFPTFDDNVSNLREYPYWNQSTGPFHDFIHNNPQPVKDGPYSDRMVAPPGEVENLESLLTVSKDRAVLIPTFDGHFDQALRMLKSLQCFCLDIDTFNIHAIASNAIEVEAFRERLATLDIDYSCPPPIESLTPPPTNKFNISAHVDVVNMYDVLPASLRKIATPNNTWPIMEKGGKYRYQGIKKLQTTRHFNYQHVLWLDSEGLAVQPFRLNDLFDAHVKEPIVWRSRTSRYRDDMPWIMESNARVLGRSMNSFGRDYWNLESLQWIIDRDIVEDLFQWVERAHGKPFWDVFYGADNPFEIGVYNLHIAARKAETTNPLFTKYKILETEREMIRFGLAPYFKHRDDFDIGGFMEYSYLLMKNPAAQPKLTAFLNRYNLHLYRIPDGGLDIAPKAVVKKFFRETPIMMLISGAADIHRWWNATSDSE